MKTALLTTTCILLIQGTAMAQLVTAAQGMDKIKTNVNTAQQNRAMCATNMN